MSKAVMGHVYPPVPVWFSYFGVMKNQKLLWQLSLNQKPFGTPIFNAKRLQKWGYRVTIKELNKADLETTLRQGQPVITRIWTTMLDYWKTDTSHVVVFVGFDEDVVYLNDPAFSTGPQTAVWDEFLATWASSMKRP